MSSIVERLAAKAEDACAKATWSQWRPLAAGAGLEPDEVFVIDPEALILGSLAASVHERRLEDRLRWWASVGLGLTGVQRFRSMLKAASPRVQEAAKAFAATAAAVDRSWKPLAQGAHAPPPPSGRSPKGPTTLVLRGSSTLMLRLRAAFGVSAKSDVLALMIAGARSAGPRRGVAVDEAARTMAYSTPSVRRALQEMALSGLVSRAPSRPARFATDVSAWAALLGFQNEDSVRGPRARRSPPPKWRDWASIYRYLDAVVALGGDRAVVAAAPVVQASRLRDLHERFVDELERSGFPAPDASLTPGTSFADAFEDHLDRLIAGIDAS